MATSGEAARIHHVMKAGWMQRESDFLKKWKRQYVVLRTNGLLVYYSNETQMDVKGSLHLPRDCFCIKSGSEVGGVAAPPGRSVGCLIEVRTSQANVVLCAESEDDAQTWKMAMQEALRANRGATQNRTVVANTVVGAPPAYGVNPPAYGVNPPAYVVNPAPAPYTVVTPGSRVTSTTYYPNGRNVIMQNSPYPMQQTIHTYPGQTIYNGRTMATYPTQTVYNGQTTTTYQVPATYPQVYQTQYYYQ